MIDRARDDDGGDIPPSERRRNTALRLLVEQMMDELRAAAAQDTWTPQERERAEEDLERIMEQVRRETFRDR